MAEKVTVVPQNKQSLIRIFVDDSNLWIEGKKTFARARGLMDSISEDPRARIDIGKMTEAISKGRKIDALNFYGSRPPPHDTVWNKAKAAGYELNIFDRSTISGREKMVDTALTADVMELLYEAKDVGTVILVSGDADFCVAAKKALKKQWQVEVYGWKGNISHSYNELKMDYNMSISTHELNCLISDRQESIMFVEREYRPERLQKEYMKKKLESDCIVMKLDPKYIDSSTNLPIQKVTDGLEGATRLPIMYYVMPHNEIHQEVIVLAVSMVDATKHHFLKNAKKYVHQLGDIPMPFKRFEELEHVGLDYFKDMFDLCKP